MPLKQNNTALLVFSRLPKTEAGIKKLFDTKDKNEILWQDLYRHTASITRGLNLTIINFTEREQQGNTFAERLTEAASSVFSRGFENIIIIGSDCPGLQKSHIKNAHDALINGKDIIAGRDKRGGVYLLAFNKKVFSNEAFLNFSWQTKFLFSELKNYSSSFNFEILSPVLRDINTLSDARISASELPATHSLRIFIIKFLSPLHDFIIFVSHYVRSASLRSNTGLRAPPTM